ncbi:MAG: hypothetical protein F6K40_27550 [Okeania sp. SIO3I5]|uniref:hypothetical protein n=1 Tax=Okeania sp. SIO3I5 TaxID=2607805 RepID=UPI0013BC6FB1|nr:hypothetical protein [Okeania sp. SIO3I5]NEQ39801.1 hypothetical protein [Okeania sp. SIO3I5]
MPEIESWEEFELCGRLEAIELRSASRSSQFLYCLTVKGLEDLAWVGYCNFFNFYATLIMVIANVP